jgi:hypothetical protein
MGAPRRGRDAYEHPCGGAGSCPSCLQLRASAPVGSYDGEDTGNGGFRGGPDGATAASDAASAASAADSSGPGVVDVGSWVVGPAGPVASLGNLDNAALGVLGMAAGFMGGPETGAQERSRVNVHEDYEVRYWTKKWGSNQKRPFRGRAPGPPVLVDELDADSPL